MRGVTSDAPLLFWLERKRRSRVGAPFKDRHRLVAVVIVIVPVAVIMPTVAVFIPPAVVRVPAPFARFTQFVPRVVRLPTVPAMMLDGFVESMIRFHDSPLTMIVIGVSPRRRRECQQANQRSHGEYRASQRLFLSRILEHKFSILM
jgi:membrane-bound metal-dependent hydrolase YbcI (DUF457 family)